MKEKDFEEYTFLTPNQYGHIICKLDEVRKQRGLSKNKLSIMSGVTYSVVGRYCNKASLNRVDLDFMAKMCYLLHCDLSDLLVYEKK